MRRRPARGVPVVLVAAALALTGCGESEEPTPTPEVEATAESAPESAGETETDELEDTQGEETEAEREDAAGGAFDVDACSLLTADQVAAATGANAEEGAVNADLSSDLQSICEWVTDASGVAFVQVVVGESSATTQRESAEEFLGTAEDVEVAGASDAYLIEGIVGAQVGPYFLQVSVVPADDDAAVELAEQAAAALG